MKHFKYMGSFKDEESLPKRDPMPEGAVAFKEIDNMKKLTAVMSIVSVVILVLMFLIVFLVGEPGDDPASRGFGIGAILALISLFPHEVLHAICMNGTVYCYMNLKMGSAFVLSNDDMSKTRFIICSLCPNFVFGVIPMVIFLFNPSWIVLGMMGAFCISMGAGDYYNIYNAATQMPKGSLTFLSGMRSYWYMPKKD